jgi:uncharacterized repeat protein (TIGR03803 family)
MRTSDVQARIQAAVFALLTIQLASVQAPGAQIMVMHNFAGGLTDGASPSGAPVIGGSKLYGMTTYGGVSNNGVIFAINLDGSGSNVLHHFTGGAADGSQPYGSLTLAGSTLYGMTQLGGVTGKGVVFSMTTNGIGFTVLHTFDGSPTNGGYPYDSVTVAGSTIYGMTQNGGSSNMGVVFKMTTSGSGYTNLHHFAGGNRDGAYPLGSLTLAGNMLHGMTYSGGASNRGVVFNMNTSGSVFNILHTFGGFPSDGSFPYGSLALVDGTLYGMSETGGSQNRGLVFSVATNGSNYAVLHQFANDLGDGSFPYGSLAALASNLYGMTALGGSNNYGAIFGLGTNGLNFKLLASFANTNGAAPFGSLVLSNPIAYGMASEGAITDSGVVFAFPLPVPPQIVGINRQGANILVSWTAVGGQSYVVQTNAPLANGGYTTNFSDCSAVITKTNLGKSTTNYLDAGAATNVPVRYYRLRLAS